MIFQKNLLVKINEYKSNNLYRVKDITPNNFLNFTSNDYFNFSTSVIAKQAAIEAINNNGLSATSSPLVSGYHAKHKLLEERIAEFLNTDAAILFPTGYMANLGIISALCDKNSLIFQDKLAHASLIDGAKLSGAKLLRYKHNDLNHLESLLQKNNADFKLICTDAVFSMDGDLADVPGLVALAAKYNCILMLDDAHGFGVLGGGKGSAKHFNQQDNVPIYMGTLSKAIGAMGGFVAGSKELIEYLGQFARSYIYTHALPVAMSVAAIAVLDEIESNHRKYYDKLKNNIDYFKQQASNLPFPLLNSDTMIQPLIVGDDMEVIKLQARLRQNNILLSAIRPPTVPKGTARIRVSLNYAHSYNDIDTLILSLCNVMDDVV